MGVSTPGGPGVVVGFNDSIAWGFTNAQRDLVDWYRIRFQDESMKRYLLDSNWVDTQVRVERIKVRGQDDFIDSVHYTVWGPVVFDRTYHDESDRKNYSFRWIAHDARNEFKFVHQLDRAKNYNEYIQALNDHYSPAQNIALCFGEGEYRH